MSQCFDESSEFWRKVDQNSIFLFCLVFFAITYTNGKIAIRNKEPQNINSSISSNVQPGGAIHFPFDPRQETSYWTIDSESFSYFSDLHIKIIPFLMKLLLHNDGVIMSHLPTRVQLEGNVDHFLPHHLVLFSLSLRINHFHRV